MFIRTVCGGRGIYPRHAQIFIFLASSLDRVEGELRSKRS